jgi:hypothetical protein
MKSSSRWPRILGIAGFCLILAGTLDPLEGSVLIAAGSGIAAAGAFLGKSRHRRLLAWAFCLILAGAAAMFIISAFGGLRMRAGQPGHSPWWGLFLLPYPAGWVLGIVGSLLRIREKRKGADQNV